MELDDILDRLNEDIYRKYSSGYNIINNSESRMYVLERLSSELERYSKLSNIMEYFITCDESNNSPDIISKGFVICDIKYQKYRSLSVHTFRRSFGIPFSVLRDKKINEILNDN